MVHSLFFLRDVFIDTEFLSDPSVHLLTCVFSIHSLLGDCEYGYCELTDNLLLQIFLSPVFTPKGDCPV